MKLQKNFNVRHMVPPLLLALILCFFAACSFSGTKDDSGESADSPAASTYEQKQESHDSRKQADTEGDIDVEESSNSDLSSQRNSDDESSDKTEEDAWYQMYTYFEDEDGNYYRVSYDDDEAGQTQLHLTSYGKDWEVEYLTAGAEDYAETVDGGYKYYDTGLKNSVMTFYPETEQLILMESGYVTDYCAPAGEMNIVDPYGFATGETWWDVNSQRCNMNIEYFQDASTGECRYEVNIAWSNSYNDSNFWEIKQGTYDESQNAIVFSDCRYYESESYADGTMMANNVYTGGTGSIVMDENHRLYWIDDVKDTGADCVFENAYYDNTDKSNESYPTEVLDSLADDNVDPLVYFLEYCDKQYFPIDYFNGFDKDMCLYALNGIYAKSGRIFSDADLRSYYSQFDWYSPTIDPDDFTENMLNEVQRANLDILVEYEVSQGYRTASSTYTEPNYNWYRTERAYTRGDDAVLDYWVQNDVVIYVRLAMDGDFYDYSFSVEPDEVGSSGELIYRSNSSVLVYYSSDNHIEFTTSDHSIYNGTYYTVS